MIYFDNASTSYPKPQGVVDHLSHIYDSPLGSYGRSRDTHTLELSSMVEELRDMLADMIGAKEQSQNIIFTKNATESINTVIRGLGKLKKEEVVISPLEHNAVTRPIFALPGNKEPAYLPSYSDGRINIEEAERFIRANKPFKLCVINGMSNLNGVFQPISEIAQIIKEHSEETKILIDGAQALPYLKLDVDTSAIDFVAITGHKSLMGPTGTGALYIRDPQSISPLIRGGNGFHSENLMDTDHMPERFETGTINLVGLSAWYIGMKERPQKGLVEQSQLFDFIQSIKEDLPYKVLSSNEEQYQGPVFSLIPKKGSPAKLSDDLYYKYTITTRFGLHCAPIAHRTLGSLQTGATRVSLSVYNTMSELAALFQALIELNE